MLTKSGIRHIKKYCREPIENIKGYREAVESEGRYDCHHINGLTFTSEELKKMNMYYHRPASELIIMSRFDHKSLHQRSDMPSTTKGDKNGMFGITGEKHPCFGRTFTQTEDTKRKLSEKLSDDKNPAWKGENCSVQSLYKRAKKKFRQGIISESEFQKFRDMWAIEQRKWRC